MHGTSAKRKGCSERTTRTVCGVTQLSWVELTPKHSGTMFVVGLVAAAFAGNSVSILAALCLNNVKFGCVPVANAACPCNFASLFTISDLLKSDLSQQDFTQCVFQWEGAAFPGC
jgi:hypothetical protein